MKDDIYVKEDSLFKKVLSFAVLKEEISISMIQREFKIGYNRASKLFDMLKNVNMIGEKIPNKKNTYKVEYQVAEINTSSKDEELHSIIDELYNNNSKEERKIDNILKDFYGDYIEDERLKKDKMHQVEYITTTTYIDKYLKKGDRILEVGAGTGAYSLHYANLGYQVDAIDLLKTNLDVLKKKVTPSMNIKAIEGNALNLEMYKDNTFDITLVLGPLYHLFKKEEELKAIDEAIRVTKPGGKIFIAFILFDLTALTWGFQDKNIYEDYGDDKAISYDFKPNNKEDFIFNLHYYQDVKEMVNRNGVKRLEFVATDGVGRAIKDTINNMTEEEYDLYVKYHLSICTREDLIGYSAHILAILEK